MSTIEWTGKKSYDPATMCHVLQAKVRDRSITVRISEEAMDDRGDAAARAVAEAKIAAALGADGGPPKEILVTNADF